MERSTIPSAPDSFERRAERDRRDFCFLKRCSRQALQGGEGQIAGNLAKPKRRVADRRERRREYEDAAGVGATGEGSRANGDQPLSRQSEQAHAITGF